MKKRIGMLLLMAVAVTAGCQQQSQAEGSSQGDMTLSEKTQYIISIRN